MRSSPFLSAYFKWGCMARSSPCHSVDSAGPKDALFGTLDPTRGGRREAGCRHPIWFSPHERCPGQLPAISRCEPIFHSTLDGAEVRHTAQNATEMSVFQGISPVSLGRAPSAFARADFFASPPVLYVLGTHSSPRSISRKMRSSKVCPKTKFSYLPCLSATDSTVTVPQGLQISSSKQSRSRVAHATSSFRMFSASCMLKAIARCRNSRSVDR